MPAAKPGMRSSGCPTPYGPLQPGTGQEKSAHKAVGITEICDRTRHRPDPPQATVCSLFVPIYERLSKVRNQDTIC